MSIFEGPRTGSGPDGPTIDESAAGRLITAWFDEHVRVGSLGPVSRRESQEGASVWGAFVYGLPLHPSQSLEVVCTEAGSSAADVTAVIWTSEAVVHWDRSRVSGERVCDIGDLAQHLL